MKMPARKSHRWAYLGSKELEQNLPYDGEDEGDEGVLEDLGPCSLELPLVFG